MNCKLKALGLALFAVLALGVLSASAASAADFHSESATTTIKGSQVGTDTLTVNAGTVQCNEATYEGVQSSATATTVKVTPKYTECKAFGFVNAPIDVNGCTYEFSGDNSNVVTSCPSSPITITAFNCWVKIGSQTSAGGTTYTNVGSGSSRHVTVHRSETISYSQESKSFPGCTNGTFNNGKHTTTFTYKCYSFIGGAIVGCWRQ